MAFTVALTEDVDVFASGTLMASWRMYCARCVGTSVTTNAWSSWKKGEKTVARKWHFNTTVIYQLSIVGILRMVVHKKCQNFQYLKVILEQFHDQILQLAAEGSYFRWSENGSTEGILIAIHLYRFAPIHLYRGSFWVSGIFSKKLAMIFF